MHNLGTLYQFEMKKLLKRRIVWITLLAGLLAAGISITSGLLGSYYVNGEKTDTNYNMYLTDRSYQEALDGRSVDQALLSEMVQAYDRLTTTEKYSATPEYQEYARPYSAIFNLVRSLARMSTAEALAWESDENGLYAQRNAFLEEKWQFYRLTEGEKDFWRAKEADIETPYVYRITDSYFTLLSSITTIGLFVLLAVSICLSNMFAEEHTRRTDQLILCSVNGRDTAYRAKILAGISFAAIFSLTITAFSFALAFGVYGTDGFHAAFQLIFAESVCPVTAGEAILILYGCMGITAVITSVIVMFLSELSRSGMITLAITSGMLILSMIIRVPSQYRIPAQIWDWLPSGFLTPWNVFSEYLLPVFGHYFTSWQAVPVIYLLVSMAVAWGGRRVYRGYQVGGR